MKSLLTEGMNEVDLAVISPRKDIGSPLPICILKARTDVDAATEYLKEVREKRSPHTLDAYRKEINRHIHWLHGRNKGFADVKVEDIAEYLEYLKSPPAHDIGDLAKPIGHPDYRPFTGPLSESSSKLAMTVVRGFYRWIQAGGYIKLNPFALSLTEKPKRKVTGEIERKIDPNVIEMIIANMPDILGMDTEMAAKRVHRARWMLSLLYMTGLRLSEAASVRTRDIRKVELNGGGGYWSLKVVRGKGGHERTIPIAECLLERWMEYRGLIGLPPLPQRGEDTYLIPSLRGAGGVEGKAIYKELKLIFAGAQDHFTELNDPRLANLKAVSTHWLRHTFGTVLAKNGSLKEVQEVLGHADISTSALYVHVDQSDIKDTLDRTLALEAPKFD